MGKLPQRVTAPKSTSKEPEGDHPPAEEDFGGGDIASPEPCPPTEDDRPLE